MTVNKHLGSTFDSFLEEDGIKDEVELRALKKMLAGRIATRMERETITRTVLARRMHTSRTLVNRLLDPGDASVTLSTLAKASHALNMPLLVLLTAHPQGSRRKRAA